MARRDAPDPLTAGFVDLCDEVIHEARRLAEVYRAKGDDRTLKRAHKMVDFLEHRRQAALDGTMLRPSDGPAFGITRFASEYDWGPEGNAMLDRLYDLEDYWVENM